MTINWNKVTWYSKIAAIVLFVGTFWLGFWLGTMKVEKVYIEVPHIILRSEKQTEPTPLGDEEAPNKHFFANGATVAVDNNFHVTIKTKDYLEGPALSYTRNTQTVASSFIVGTSTLDYYHSSDGLFVKEGPYEWYETSGAQCGACARATINVYYFNLTKGTSTLAFTYTNLYDQNDSDFELSLDCTGPHSSDTNLV